MARRSSRRGAKIQPAVKTMTFSLTTGEADTASFDTIDLSQCASLVNRRFYRAGLNWAVAGFTLFTKGVGEINIYKIPDTWIATNSWHKGYAVWRQMNNEALEDAESVRPKFLDYKVFMDDVHHNQGVVANLIPLDGQFPPQEFVKGEWDMSSYKIPRGAASPGISSDREIIWTGASYPGAGASGKDAVGLIEGYAASRGLPDIEDPNTPDDAADATGFVPENWITALGSEGTDQDAQVLGDMINENDIAPYPFENDGVHLDTMYPGGANQAPGLQIHDVSLVTATTVGGKTSVGGTNFQGGLIRIRNKPQGEWLVGFPIVQVHLVPGPARGYMTQPMQDV